MTSFDFIHADKLSDVDEAFLRDEWSAIEGDGQAMAASGGVAVTVKELGDTVAVAKGWHAGGVAYLSELMVGAKHRNRGLGTQLLQEFERACIKAGARRLALRVQEGSPAHSLYAREGWSVELTIEDWLDGHTYLQLRKDL